MHFLLASADSIGPNGLNDLGDLFNLDFTRPVEPFCIEPFGAEAFLMDPFALQPFNMQPYEMQSFMQPFILEPLSIPTPMHAPESVITPVDLAFTFPVAVQAAPASSLASVPAPAKSKPAAKAVRPASKAVKAKGPAATVTAAAKQALAAAHTTATAKAKPARRAAAAKATLPNGLIDYPKLSAKKLLPYAYRGELERPPVPENFYPCAYWTGDATQLPVQKNDTWYPHKACRGFFDRSPVILRERRSSRYRRVRMSEERRQYWLGVFGVPPKSVPCCRTPVVGCCGSPADRRHPANILRFGKSILQLWEPKPATNKKRSEKAAKPPPKKKAPAKARKPAPKRKRVAKTSSSKASSSKKSSRKAPSSMASLAKASSSKPTTSTKQKRCKVA